MKIFKGERPVFRYILYIKDAIIHYYPKAHTPWDYRDPLITSTYLSDIPTEVPKLFLVLYT